MENQDRTVDIFYVKIAFKSEIVCPQWVGEKPIKCRNRTIYLMEQSHHKNLLSAIDTEV